MLNLGLYQYRSPNLVLDLKMWEDIKPNLPVCSANAFKIDINSSNNFPHCPVDSCLHKLLHWYNIVLK